MKCKKHLTDFSSAVGVCASCLRDRLLHLIAAQEQAHAAAAAAAAEDDRRKSDTIPPPLIFPRSVSPYISRRKSDANSAVWDDPRRPDHRRFYSTPQVGPSGGLIAAGSCGRASKKKSGIRFSFFGYLFRSKSDRNLESDPGPGPVLHTAESCAWPAPSPAWYSSVFSSRRKKQSRTFSLEEPVAGIGQRRICRNPERGMSPARFSDGEDEHCSGYSSESSQPWKQTPRSTPAVCPAGKRGGKPAAAHSRNVSGMNFCLSPLVRASPGRHWSKKGVPPEMVVAGDIRVVPVKPSLTNATSFCKNRSRKLADFGRFHQNR